MNIIALRGTSRRGKTSTIGMLRNILVHRGYQLIEDTFEKVERDFISIFTKGDKLIGISSSGDLYDIVKRNLDYLISRGCTYCVCACHTRDNEINGIILGTNAAINSFVDFDREFVDKTIEKDKAKQDDVNQADALILFTKLNSLL